MNKTTTPWHRRYVLPACLTTGVFLFHASVSSAEAQLLASNTIGQTDPAPAARELVSLKTLLRQWETDYKVTIFYESKLVGSKRVLPLPDAGSLEDKLEAVLPQADLKFKKLRDNYFVVVSKSETTSGNGPASSVGAVQDVPVAGRVTDANGQGMPGVTVIVKGTTTGTATNADGSFALNVPENSTLVFSSVGYMKQELAITGANPSITITLQEDLQQLNEVVVVGYGTQTRQELTTAVTSVSASQIARQPVAGFDQALQGQAPGVQVTSPSGAPGSGINVRIRGNATVNQNASPLYVIDGVPILPDYQQEVSTGNQRVNPLNALNPNDIESIDVLKDGAAAAIYGVRAANGVVVITTKRGKQGKPQVGLNVYYGRQELRKKIDVLNSRQFAEFYNEAAVNNGGAPYFTRLDTLTSTTDWQDEVYRPASIQSYQLNVSGATDKTRYYLAGGYFKQEGISLNSGFDRYNFKINLDQELGSRFRTGTNLNLSRTNNNGSVRSESGIGNSGTVVGAIAQIPTMPVYNRDGSYAVNPIYPFDNPVGNLLETHNNAVIYQAIGNVYGELDVLKNLRLRSSVGIDFRTQTENQYIGRNYPGTLNAAADTRGSGRTALNQQIIWLVENTLTYNPNLGDRHNLTLLVGQSAQESNRFTSGASGKGYPTDLVPYLSAVSQFDRPSSYEDSWGLLSYFARANYSFDDRYLLMFSMRADGSSRFKDGEKFGYFPAVSAGWRISKEGFFPQDGPVSDLKLRGSFGANGNQEIYTYQRFARYALGAAYQNSAGIVSGVYPQNIGNEDIKWETTYQTNVGLDVGMLSGRLQLTFDAYLKRTQDLLVNVNVPLSTGSQELTVIQNVGRVENKGIELGLNTTNVQQANNGFGWTTNFNITMNRNKVLDLGTIPGTDGGSLDREFIDAVGSSITRAGAPLGAFYGYKVAGIFQNDDEVANAPTQEPGTRPGDLRFVDTNGDGKINDDDRVIIGNPNPTAIAGVTNNFSFKGLELSVFFQGSFGNDIYNQNRTVTEGMNNALNQTTRVLDRWTPNNPNTDVPRAVLGDPSNNNRFSDRFLEDGSYVRLKNVTLAYNFPTTLVQRAKLSNLRLYVTGQNLITWTDYSGYDPEVSADPFSTTSIGRDFGVYPQARTYTVGLNATF
jgi:TonB-linked SusC/RagA family outer membrane protein